MIKILALDSSVSGPTSVSRSLMKDTIKHLTRDAATEVTYRDLGASPVPHLTSETIAGVRGTPTSDQEHATRALSDELLNELRAADIVVLGAPMYNFSIATGLRAWFDYVLRAGETFRYSEAGPEGLLSGKRAIVIESRGGLYSEGPAKVLDFQEPYLRQLFGFMGVTDVTFIRAEKIGFGADARQAAIAGAVDEIASLSRPLQAEAA